ncbi:MAG: hypothetical protein WCR51_11715 [Planctomycetia bacterium]
MTNSRFHVLGRSLAVAVVLGAATSCTPAAWAADAQPSAAPSAANPADAILGDWKPADMDVAIRIFNAKGQYVGGVVKAANPAMINTEMLRGIAYDPKSGTWRGEIFALKRGEFVPMTIRMTPAGFEMVAGAGFLSKTIEWVRAPVEPPAENAGTR